MQLCILKAIFTADHQNRRVYVTLLRMWQMLALLYMHYYAVDSALGSLTVLLANVNAENSIFSSVSILKYNTSDFITGAFHIKNIYLSFAQLHSILQLYTQSTISFLWLFHFHCHVR